MTLWWTAVAFISGSLMFSYWLGLAARKNLKEIGDGNPGALNLWQSSGYRLGAAGVALDFLKGYLPIALLMGSAAVQGFRIVPIAAAPILGHAFSPFLKGRGGKAIAVTFGVWSGLTEFEFALVYAIILAVLLIIAKTVRKGRPTSSEADSFQVVSGMLLAFPYLYIRDFPAPVMWCWLGNFLLLVYTHRRELSTFFRRIRNEPGAR
ncbi:glycerol-3-phosphate acyltransferase [Paenibacillus sepulcri]|uniref:Glycerol-3-phosphate acyltransferase n=1 Tax=Paenibacillus sepulcri TaxID=359917 RepID=A0ABS7C673_9BACL|nr:glycerol-3-phosphate acyltransferase [Paenibacillus sepulcri]